VSREYYILQPGGSRLGPWPEEELLDLLESGSLQPGDPCEDAATGRICSAGELFQVLPPETVATPAPPPAVPWSPAPFPKEDAGNPAGPVVPDNSRPRLLYRGNPCALTYWKSVLAAAALVAGSVLGRDAAPWLPAPALVGASFILLAAVLHRLRTQYSITSARVEVIRGLLARSSRELRIADIRAINVTRSGLPGLLGIGSVAFSSAAGPKDDVVFDRVLRASSLKNLVRKLQGG
jgi:hypothetical protein